MYFMHPGGTSALGPCHIPEGIRLDGPDKIRNLIDIHYCSLSPERSCRAGVCHMCESGLIDGEVQYFSEPLDPPGKAMY